ncbi:MAG: ATP-dependent helicase [Ilumatobacteraceae bacterium]
MPPAAELIPGDVPRPTSALSGLDPAQAAAVTTPSTLVAVIAGAGSGKTRVLTTRIAHRVAIGTADARHTLALTFTREAAGELRRRLRRSGVRDHVEAGTFHAVALALLRQRWADLDRRPPTVVGDRERLLAEVAGGVALPTLATEADWAAARGLRADEYVAAARAVGRRGPVPPDRIAAVLAAYETLKRRRGVVDLDDLLALASRELAANPQWADAVRFRYRHVLVDEAQDLNPLQHRLLEQIVGGRDDLYLVGDPAQAIYGFNGSDPGLLLDVAIRMPGVEIIHLPTNHRCTPQIVGAATAVLRAGGQDSDAESNRGDGPAVRIVAADDEDHEAALVATLVRSLDPWAVRSGAVAVLARTNAQVHRLTSSLTNVGIPIMRRKLSPGSPLATVVKSVTALPSATRLRAWAHDVLEVDPRPSVAPDPIDAAERRMAAAVLEFLRDQPFGDGAELRTWVASTNPFAEPDDVVGVEVLTFHAAKGREWHTVVVTGVETGLMPHRSATTGEAKAEEARLLHVAITRASDLVVLTWSARRGGYKRQASPLIADIDTAAAPTVAPPAALRTVPPIDRGPLDRLGAWRERMARMAMILPTEVCSNADLEAIAAAAPLDPGELVAVTTFGPLTADRLFPGIRAALDG